MKIIRDNLRIFYIAVLLLLPLIMYGQEQTEYTVSGTIVEEKSGNPLAFSKIYVTDSLGTQVKRTLTLDDGKFRFKVSDGKYSVLFTNTGHKSVTLGITVLGADRDLGEIVLTVGEEIQEAGITAANLLTRTDDRYIYDVSRDPDKNKISMMEMMSRIPQLRQAAKDGNLEFRNEKVNEILINDAKNGLVNGSRQYPMEFIKAGYMKTIELVMPGSPEYRNDKPILLITLAKSFPYGFAGNIEGKADTRNNYSPSADIVANTPWIGAGVSYHYDYSGEPALTDSTFREMTDGTVIDSRSTERSTVSSHNFGMNFFRGFLDDRINLNASLKGRFTDGTSFSESLTNGISESLSEGASTSPFRLNGAINLNGSFGPASSGRRSRKYQWSLGYSYRDDYSSSWTRHTYSSFLPLLQTSVNDEQEHRIVGKLDMRQIVRKPFTASVSLKTGWFGRRYDNSSLNGDKSEGMDYRQDVAFVEVAALGSLLKRLSYLIYLNAEYIDNSGVFVNGENVSPLDYNEFNLMPNIGLTWKSKYGNITVSYNRNVRRPSMSQLNPYTDIRDPYNIRTGNPDLKGENTDNYYIGYNLVPRAKWVRNLRLSVSYSDSKNLISRIVTSDSDGISTSTYCNIGNKSSVSGMLSAEFVPAKSMSMSLVASYSHNRSVLPSGRINIFGNPMATMSVSWYPRWFEITGSVVLRPTLVSVQTTGLKIEPDAELSISRYFAKPHLGVSIGVYDIFHSGGMRSSTIGYDNFIQYNYNERRGRIFSFRVYWRFGKFRQPKEAEVEAYDSIGDVM